MCKHFNTISTGSISKICFKEDEAQPVVQRFFGQKQFKGTVPQKIREFFFVSVNFFWFEMARGEFSGYSTKSALETGEGRCL